MSRSALFLVTVVAAATCLPTAAAAQRLESNGWSLEPRGRFQVDVGRVERPAGVTAPDLGTVSEIRRARLGIQGDIPGGFGYTFEADFSGGGAVEVTDAFLTYKASDRVRLTAGQHNPFQSLEELTSSRFTSFLERAAFTDAFNFERRVGLSANFSKGPLIASGGLFTDPLPELTGDDEAGQSAGADGRVVYAPKLRGVQFHLGGSAHYRDLAGGSDATARYRERPLIHATEARFVATPRLPTRSESQYGLEAALIRGPLHAAGELHWLHSELRGPRADPTFFGGYAEVGYYFTGETRGYKGGRFDRTTVKRPIDKGGAGALQLNLRYDHLSLNDAGIVGGRQQGYQASLIWIPHDQIRFLLSYARLDFQNAAIPAAGGDRNYGIDVVGARAQLDF
jgi:phosphate-selective porin OprO/OprP